MLYNKCLTSKVTSRLLRFSECTQILEFLSSASFMERGDSLAEMAWLNDLGMKCMTPAVKIPLFTSHTTLSYGGNKTLKCHWLETISHLSSHHDLPTFDWLLEIFQEAEVLPVQLHPAVCVDQPSCSLCFPHSRRVRWGSHHYCFSFNNRLYLQWFLQERRSHLESQRCSTWPSSWWLCVCATKHHIKINFTIVL